MGAEVTFPRVIVLMGVSGSGKSLIGQMLAERLRGRFFDGDHFHPPENVLKMSRGIALSDEDRWPWLKLLRREVIEAAPEGEIWVLACSALKESYRRCLLPDNDPSLTLVYLSGSFDLIYSRISARIGHYMKESLLRSQFEALEPPSESEAVIVSVDQNPTEVVSEIIEKVSRRTTGV